MTNVRAGPGCPGRSGPESRVADFARGRGSRGGSRRPPATLPTRTRGKAGERRRRVGRTVGGLQGRGDFRVPSGADFRVPSGADFRVPSGARPLLRSADQGSADQGSADLGSTAGTEARRLRLVAKVSRGKRGLLRASLCSGRSRTRPRGPAPEGPGEARAGKPRSRRGGAARAS